jgi:hypothetical protein
MLHNSPEGHIFHQRHGRSLNSRVKFVVQSLKFTLYVYKHKGKGQSHKKTEML